MLEVLIDQLLSVIDDTDAADCVGTKVRADQHGLGIGIGDNADRRGALHLTENMLKFCSERCVFDIVDLALETDLGIVGGKSAASGSEMGMVVNAEEHIHHAILV